MTSNHLTALIALCDDNGRVVDTIRCWRVIGAEETSAKDLLERDINDAFRTLRNRHPLYKRVFVNRY